MLHTGYYWNGNRQSPAWAPRGGTGTLQGTARDIYGWDILDKQPIYPLNKPGEFLLSAGLAKPRLICALPDLVAHSENSKANKTQTTQPKKPQPTQQKTSTINKSAVFPGLIHSPNQHSCNILKPFPEILETDTNKNGKISTRVQCFLTFITTFLSTPLFSSFTKSDSSSGIL